MAKGVPILGKDPLGKAKYANVTAEGDLKVQLSGTKAEETEVLYNDYRDKVAGSEIENPNKAYVYGGATNPQPGSGNEFTQARYDNIMDKGVRNTSFVTKANGFYAQQLYSFDILNHFKRKGNIPIGWTVADLKRNTKSLEVEWIGRGYAPGGVGAVVKYYNPSTGQYSEGIIQSSDEFSSVVINVANAIDEDGFIHLVAQSLYPSDGSESLATLLTRYIGVRAVFLVEVLQLAALSTQLRGSNTEETKTLYANITEQIYSPSISDYGVVVIQNLDKYVPIEIVLNDVFPAPTSTASTPNPDDFTNVHRIYPGQSMKFRNSPRLISYRSTAGNNIKIRVSCGYDVEVTPLPNLSTFSDFDPIRFYLLCADRHSNKVFASQSVYLYFSNNGGKTWVRQNTNLPAGIKTAFYTRDGTLLLTTLDHQILRSTDDGKTFTTVMTDTYGWRGTDGIAQDSLSGAIVFGENASGVNSDLSLWRSTDDGQTWTEVLKRTPNDIRHWHSVQIDPYTKEWLATTGDTDAQVEWWRSSDGINWTAIVGADSGVEGSQMYRTLGVFFTQDSYVWGTDNPLWGYDQNFIITAKKNNLAELNKTYPLSGPAYAHVQFADMWVLGTQPEGRTMSDRTARLYVSKDEGKSWTKELSWTMRDGDSKGGFTWASLPDKEGNFYLRLLGLEGIQSDPWFYGTLKVIV